ncbi:MAG TPA: EthD domain-containing protein [Alphaproteobacteria bacterium]|nr:EthD domain-containing protein [Alphaproteobacteria bacterium]
MTMKVITPIKRRPELTRAQFRDYYETRHAPLGTRYFPFAKYVRNHLIEASPEDPGYDCLMECWLDREKALSLLDGNVGAIFAEDEAKFMVTRGVGVDVAERVIAGPPRSVDPRGLKKEILVLTGPAERVRAWARDIARTAGSACARLVLDEVLPGQESMNFPGDAVLTAWPAGDRPVLRPAVPPDGVTIRASLLVESDETTPQELKDAFGKRP